MARTVPMTTTTAPNPQPPGGGGAPEQGGMPYDKYLKKLEKLGYTVKDGVIVQIADDEVSGQVTPEVLALLQKGKNLFGLNNEEYDANRVYYDKKSDDYYGLGTGSSGSGGSPATDQQLALWQSVTGYSPETELAYWQEHYAGIMPNGYIPAAFSDLEKFTKYQEAARNNYLYDNDVAQQREQIPGTWAAGPPAGQEETTWLGKGQGRPEQFAAGPKGFWDALDPLDDESLFGISDTVNQMLQARKQRASARTFQSDFFDMSDFEMEE